VIRWIERSALDVRSGGKAANVSIAQGTARSTYPSIRGNNGTGLPTTCPSGKPPHFASSSRNRSSFPLNSGSIFQFS